MTVLTTSLDRSSEAFAANTAAMRGLVEDLREKGVAIREGGGAGVWPRHLSRGKLLPHECGRCSTQARLFRIVAARRLGHV